MKAGYHTPEMTTRLLKELNEKSPIPFEDSSWHNDQVDSAYNVDYQIHVYFPNSEEDNAEEELFNDFQVETETGEVLWGSMAQVIAFISEYVLKVLKEKE